MQGGKNHQSQSSQSNSESHLDPTVMNNLTSNIQGANSRLGNLQYQGLTGANIQQFQNPYTSSVVDATNHQMDLARQQAISTGHATAVGQGAFGGSRTGVLDALTNKDYLGQMATTDAGLNSQGYTQALQAAMTQNQNMNQYPLLIQQALNQAYGLLGNPTVGTSQSTGTGSGSGWTFGFGGGGGGPSPSPEAAAGG